MLHVALIGRRRRRRPGTGVSVRGGSSLSRLALIGVDYIQQSRNHKPVRQRSCGPDVGSRSPTLIFKAGGVECSVRTVQHI